MSRELKHAGRAGQPRPRGARQSRTRVLTVWLATTVAFGCGALLCVATLLDALGTLGDPTRAAEQAVVLVAAAAGTWAAVHVWVLSSLTVLDLLRAASGSVADGSHPTRRHGAVRRLTLLACGVAVSAGTALPSYAAEPTRPEPTSELAVLDGLPYPDRASTSAPTEDVSGETGRDVTADAGRTGGSTQARVRHDAPGRPVPATSTPAKRPGRDVPGSTADARTVRPGDSLWSIAEDLTGSSDAPTVAARVDELHRTNRAVIGDDPDLIHPGQRLRVRPAPEERTTPHDTDQSRSTDRSQEGPR